MMGGRIPVQEVLPTWHYCIGGGVGWMDGLQCYNVGGGVLMMGGQIPVQAVLPAWRYRIGGGVGWMDGLQCYNVGGGVLMMGGRIPVQEVLPAWRYHGGRGGHRAVWSSAGIELHRLWVRTQAVCCLQLLTASLAVMYAGALEDCGGVGWGREYVWGNVCVYADICVMFVCVVCMNACMCVRGCAHACLHSCGLMPAWACMCVCECVHACMPMSVPVFMCVCVVCVINL